MANETTRSCGQPTKYKPEYCQEFIKMREQGMIVQQIATAWDIHIDSIYEWRKVHPAFSVAFTRGTAAYEAWLYNELKINATNPKANANIFKIICCWQMNRTDKVSDNPTVLPDFDGTIEQRLDAIKKAFKEGKINTPQYHDLTSALEKESKIREASEMARRIEELEKQLKIS